MLESNAKLVTLTATRDQRLDRAQLWRIERDGRLVGYVGYGRVRDLRGMTPAEAGICTMRTRSNIDDRPSGDPLWHESTRRALLHLCREHPRLRNFGPTSLPVVEVLVDFTRYLVTASGSVYVDTRHLDRFDPVRVVRARVAARLPLPD